MERKIREKFVYKDYENIKHLLMPIEQINTRCSDCFFGNKICGTISVKNIRGECKRLERKDNKPIIYKLMKSQQRGTTNK